MIDPTSLSSRYEVSTPAIKGTFTDGAFIISIYATEWFTSVPFSEDWHTHWDHIASCQLRLRYHIARG